jgi:xanthine dehydrogenase accessory factor
MDKERILHAHQEGLLRLVKDIGEPVSAREIVTRVGNSSTNSPISGVIWGIIRNGSVVKKGQKIGDIDPRGKAEYCFQIAPQARAIAGGVLEAIIRSQVRGVKKYEIKNKRTF